MVRGHSFISGIEAAEPLAAEEGTTRTLFRGQGETMTMIPLSLLMTLAATVQAAVQPDAPTANTAPRTWHVAPRGAHGHPACNLVSRDLVWDSPCSGGGIILLCPRSVVSEAKIDDILAMYDDAGAAGNRLFIGRSST